MKSCNVWEGHYKQQPYIFSENRDPDNFFDLNVSFCFAAKHIMAN